MDKEGRVGRTCGSETNSAKWLAGHAAALATDRAIQTMGGMDYAAESHVERLWRDARLFHIAPISEERMLNYVAPHDLGMPRSYGHLLTGAAAGQHDDPLACSLPA